MSLITKAEKKKKKPLVLRILETDWPSACIHACGKAIKAAFNGIKKLFGVV